MFFSPRLLLQAVSVATLAGLVAGCGGGGSPQSLPMTSSVGDGAMSINARFAQQAKTGVFPASNIKLTQASQAEYLAASAALQRAINNQAGKRTQNYGTGIPTGFGYTTATSGPYTGIQVTATAYNDAQFGLGYYCSASGAVGATGGCLNATPNYVYMPLAVAPNGGCLIPFVKYRSSPEFGGNRNLFGALDECQHVLYETSLTSLAAFIYTMNGSPVMTFGVFANGPISSSSTWTVVIYDPATQTYKTYATSTGQSNLNNNAGGIFWLDQIQPPPCPQLPNQTNPAFTLGLAAENAALYSNAGGGPHLDPLQNSMSGGYATAFNGPNTQLDTCFGAGTLDGTPRYVVNQQTNATYGNGFSVTSHNSTAANP